MSTNSSESTTSPANRAYAIDLLRFLAITMVILVHTTNFPPGRFGVQVFFAVSGYLLFAGAQKSVRTFLIRRSFRLFPLWLVMLVSWTLISEQFSSIEILSSIFLFNNFVPLSGIVPGGWSISAEWIFSLLIVVIVMIPNRKIAFFGLLVFSIVFQFLSGLFVYMRGGIDSTTSPEIYEFYSYLNTTNPLNNLAFFLLGLGLKAGYLPQIKQKLFLAIMMVIPVFVEFLIGHVMFLWFGFVYCLFTYTLNAKLIIKFKLITLIGQRTYGLYFGHFVVICISDSILPSTILDNSIPYFLTVYLFSFVFATFTWYVIESPFLKLSQKITGTHKKH